MVALSESVPEMYAVVIEQVMVMLPLVLLKIETMSPSAKVASGMTIAPLVPTCTYLPMSVVASVYEAVLVPTAGTFRKPTLYPLPDESIKLKSPDDEYSEMPLVNVPAGAVPLNKSR